MAKQPDHEAHGELGDDLEDVDVDRDVHHRHGQKQLRNRQFGNAQQQDRDNRRDHHEQRVENVVGGDDARALFQRRARLDQGVQRHDVKATEYADTQNIEQHQPALP